MALNRYMYVMGNPINFVDPRGHVPILFDEDGCLPPGPDIGGILNPDSETLNNYYGANNYFMNDLNYDRSDITSNFMCTEMMTSINSKTVTDIKSAINLSQKQINIGNWEAASGMYIAALFKWAWAVRPGGRWDHKRIIDEMLGLEEQGDYYFPIRGDTTNEWYMICGQIYIMVLLVLLLALMLLPFNICNAIRIINKMPSSIF